MKNSFLLLVICLLVLFSSFQLGSARKGRGKGRTKGGMKNTLLPIGGKWRDPDTAKYYTNSMRAKITKASHFDLEYILGHKIYFLCEAEGQPRPQVTWFKDGIEIYQHSNLQLHEWRYGEGKIKSKMEIDPATQMDSGIYDCVADNLYAVDKKTFRTDFVTQFD